MSCSGKYVGSPRPVSTTVSVSPLCASWIAFYCFFEASGVDFWCLSVVVFCVLS